MTKLEPQEEIIILRNKIDKLQKLIDEEKSVFKIKTYSELCKFANIKELTIKDFSFLPKDEQEKALAFHQVKNIEKVFNGNWIKDWSNKSQYKWYPYYNLSPPGGLVFSTSYYGCDGCDVAVSFYKDKETSDYVGKTFINIYEKLK